MVRKVGMDEDGRTPETTNLVTGLVSGNVVQAGYVGAVHLGTGPRTRYLGWVRDIAPETLVGREAELAELAAFCTAGDEGPAYAWWLGEAWTGKSALMSTFVLDPPPGVRVVSFFVTARLGGADDRVGFVGGVLEQLAALLGEAVPGTSPEVHLRGMLAEAAEECRTRGERLVLVVDGLDEDRGVGPGPAATRSIAALLPARPAAGLRVIVASRPNPPVPADVPDDHPLRDAAIRRCLKPSPAAQADRADMERELDLLLHGTPGDRDLVGLIIAANGGLSAGDLGELTGRSAREIDRKLNSVASRSFTRRPAVWRPQTAPEVYLLGHEDLRSAADAELEEELREDCRRRLFQWAEEYRRRGWPEETPQYLLGGFVRLLSSDPSAMVAYATDPARQERLLDLSGNDVAALTQLTAAENACHEVDAPDLVSLIRLAVHRDNLTDRNIRIPGRLPALWATLGRPDHAEAMLRSIADPRRRSAALIALIKALVGSGDQDRAESLARDVADGEDRTAALWALADATGDVDLATTLAQSITDPELRKRQLARLAVLGDDGDADRAETTARTIIDPVQLPAALYEITEALLAKGDFDRALAMAESITDDWWRAAADSDLVRALCQAGETDRALALSEKIAQPFFRGSAVADLIRATGHDLRRARELAETIADAGTREYVLPALVEVMARAGDHTQARTLLGTMTNSRQRQQAVVALAAAMGADERVDAAMALAVTPGAHRPEPESPDVAFQAETLAALADSIVLTGDLDQARKVAETAESVARTAAHSRELERMVRALATAVCAAGDVRRAETLARLIIDPANSQDAVRRLADLLSVAGDIDVAEALARNIIRPYQAAEPLAALVRRARVAGDANRVRRLAGHAESLLRPERGAASELAAGGLARVVAAAGEPDRACAIAETIPEGPGRTRALVQLIRESAAAGEGDRALELAKTITGEHDRRRAIIAVVEGMGAAGEAERAVEIAEAQRRPDDALLVLVRELAARDPRQAMSVAARIRSSRSRAQALVAAAEHAPELRRRFLADAMRTDHWERTVAALDQSETTDLLGVVDELSLLHRSRGLPPAGGR
jgi:tetratricopeptide (TPR) repeat protein